MSIKALALICLVAAALIFVILLLGDFFFGEE